MRETRKEEFHFFSIADYEKEQEYLRKMHQNGWRFINVFGLGSYTFEACPPEDVIYQLDYNREGQKHKDEYIQMFQDCGWQYLQDFSGYSYFCKPAGEDMNESIFCDDESRLEMMKRIFYGRMIPMLIIFFLCLVPNFMNFINTRDTGLFDLIIRLIYIVIMAIYLWIFISFAKKYYIFKRDHA